MQVRPCIEEIDETLGEVEEMVFFGRVVGVRVTIRLPRRIHNDRTRYALELGRRVRRGVLLYSRERCYRMFVHGCVHNHAASPGA